MILKPKWLNRLKHTRKGDLADFNNVMNQQRAVNELVAGTLCPVKGCPGHLQLVGYENNHDHSHLEIAITCSQCHSQFVWTKQGLKVGYKHGS